MIKKLKTKNIENQIKTTKSFHVKEGRSLQLMEASSVQGVQIQRKIVPWCTSLEH
jgi:hypothetical protein